MSNIALIKVSPLTVFAIVPDGTPTSFDILGYGVVAFDHPSIVDAGGIYKVVPVVDDVSQPNTFATLSEQVLSFDGTTLTRENLWTTNLAAYSAFKYQSKMGGGVTVSSAAIPTDAQSQFLLTSAYVMALQNVSTPGWTVPMPNGGASTASQIIGIFQAVSSFVAACITAENSISSQITGGTITNTAQIDAIYAAINTTF